MGNGFVGRVASAFFENLCKVIDDLLRGPFLHTKTSPPSHSNIIAQFSGRRNIGNSSNLFSVKTIRGFNLFDSMSDRITPGSSWRTSICPRALRHGFPTRHQREYI